MQNTISLTYQRLRKFNNNCPNLKQMCMGFAPVFTGLLPHVPVESSQQEIILSTVRALASRLKETKQQKHKKEKFARVMFECHKLKTHMNPKINMQFLPLLCQLMLALSHMCQSS